MNNYPAQGHEPRVKFAPKRLQRGPAYLCPQSDARPQRAYSRLIWIKREPV